MPLLSLPQELLFEIAICVQGTGFQTTCNSSPGPTASTSSSSSLDIFKLAQTCHALRSVCLTLIYPTIVTDTRPGKLERLLADFPVITAQVRTLTVWACQHRYAYTASIHTDAISTLTVFKGALEKRSTMPPPVAWQLQGVLANCTNLTSLTIKQPRSQAPDPGNSLTPKPSCLSHLAPSTKHTLTTLTLHNFRLVGLLAQFRGLLAAGFTALHTFRIENLNMNNPPSYQETTKLAHHLAHLSTLTDTLPATTLHLHAPLTRPSHSERPLGALLARALPHVTTLDATAGAACIHALLGAFAAAHQPLAHIALVVPPPSYQPAAADDAENEVCALLAALAPALVTLVWSGERACQRLLVGEWGVLAEMRVRCRAACTGGSWRAVEGWVRGRPRARGRVQVVLGSGVCGNGGREEERAMRGLLGGVVVGAGAGVGCVELDSGR